jgi:hypothetical protein
MMNPTTVEAADKIEMAWIRSSVDIEQAKAAYMPQPRPNKRSRHQFEMPPLGTWVVNPWGGIEVLVEIPVDQFQPSEGEWDFALRYPETQDYIQWQRDGHEPPPLSVIRTARINGRGGNLRSCNRRRWLAAREAGVKSLKCWYSPTHPDHCASPKWDVKYL